MFFRLRNSPATFQNMMNDIMAEPDGDPSPHKNEGYMDDLMPHGKTREECRANTLRTLAKLNKYGLSVNLKKCLFEVEEVDFLGMIVRHNYLAMDPVKVEGLANWPVPTGPNPTKQLRGFMGFGNFYHRFVPRHSTIAAPLNALLKKDTPWNWTDECQQAFDTLKKKFTSYPVLMMPDLTKPF